jgi:hypothetical protein
VNELATYPIFYLHSFSHFSTFISHSGRFGSLYPVRKLHHVRRVDAEEDVQDFRNLSIGLDPW